MKQPVTLVNKHKKHVKPKHLSIHLGIIVGAFIVEKWLPATKEYFPMYPPVSNRYGFR